MSCLNNLRRRLTFVITLFICQSLFAQTTHPGNSTKPHTPHPGCGFDHHQDDLFKTHPELREQLFNYKQRVLPLLQQNKADARQRMNTLTVPVVVHVIHSGEAVGTGSNISDARIQAQIDILNEDFSAMNANYSQTPARWAGSVGNPDIQFCLASIDDESNPTNGITRQQMTVTGTTSRDANIESDIKPVVHWNANQYYNIYVLPIPGTTAGGGVTGYAYLPYSGTVGNGSFDGSVVDWRWFGGPGFGQSGFKTLTHETGHYLGLFHTFNGDDCADDDGIADTPNIGESTSESGWFSCNGGFPTGPMSCGNEHMYVNYMDYSSSSCYTSFTNGQNQVMRAVLDGTAATFGFGSRLALVNHTATACTFVEDDAAVATILSPTESLCNNSNQIVPQVELQNFGNTNLSSATIYYQVDNQTPVMANWTGNLATGEKETITLNSFTKPGNAFAFQAYVVNPNGRTDERTENDTMTVQVNSIALTSLPISENFDVGATSPFASGIRIWNIDSDRYAFNRTTDVSGFGAGTAALVMNNYDAESDINNTQDAIVTPVFDFSGVSNAELTFDVAYTSYQDATNFYTDSLLVMVSTDCGSRFDQVIYRNGGATLHTASPTDQAFVPTNTQWRTETINLSNYDGQSDVSIAIINKSGWGNRLYIDNINIETSCALSIAMSSTAETVNGANDGTASVTVSGGAAPYTYSWNNGATTDNITNLSPGLYTVTVTDLNNCIATNEVNVEAGPVDCSGFDATGSATNVDCFNGTNGEIFISTTGGTSPFEYSWNGGSQTVTTNSFSISTLSAGDYSVTVRDADLCEAILAYTITQAPELSFQKTVTAETDVDADDGTVSVDISGGTPTYSILWSNGATTTSISGLAPGVYVFTVTDSNNCTKVDEVKVNEATLDCSDLQTSISGQDVFCFGQGNGSASIQVNGGQQPYIYNWSNGATTATLNNIGAGTYSVTVTDGRQCVSEKTITIEQPTILSATIQKEDQSYLNTPNGSATATPTGGTSPYTYLWSNNETTSTITGLIPGVYTLTITDANSCIAIVEAGVDAVDCSGFQIETATEDESCNGSADGYADIITSNGSGPFTFAWSHGRDSESLNDLAEGNYTVTVTDNQGCSATEAIQINSPEPVDASLRVFDGQCGRKGSILANGNGGVAPFSYRWGNGVTDNRINNLIAGTYGLTVTDANGCTAEFEEMVSVDEDNIGIAVETQHITCAGMQDGALEAIPTAGVAPFTYSWSNGSTVAKIEQLEAGNYTLSVTDSKGCVYLSVFIVNEPAELEAEIEGSSPTMPVGDNGSAQVVTQGGVSPYTYQWSNGFSGINNTGLSAGNYNVTVRDFNGCETFADITLDLSTATNDFESLKKWMIAPNPVLNVLSINAGFENPVQGQLTLYNISGQPIQSTLFDGQEVNERFDLSKLPAGAYLLYLETEVGRRVERIIKL